MARARRLILHLGHGKTGSTAIQRALFSSPAALAEAGVLFPNPGRHENHQLIFPRLWGVLPEEDLQRAALGRSPKAIFEQAERMWSGLKERIARDRPETVVLSCENQFQPFPPEAFARLNAACAEIAETVTVIAYLRSPAPFFLSNVQQDIKKRPEFRWVSASRIRDTLEPVLEHGPGPLIARPYERASLSDGDVVNDFCRQVLPALDPAALKRQPDTDNATVSAEAMRLLQQVFRAERPLPKPYGRDPKGFRKLLVATDPTVPGMTRPCLHEEVRQIVEARVTDGDWVADRLGVRFDDVAPPGITRDAAEQRFKRLRDIDQLCPVDADRQEALWQAAVAAAARDARPAARLARLLRGGPAT
ncbi:MAG: hypothetical protein KDK26_18425 [Roseivivax sp.]|nr:hypothetical protein [Roseivivax sp.]